MSAGFHRLGTNVPGKVTGYSAAGLTIPSAPPLEIRQLSFSEINPPQALESTFTSHELARHQGYTGDQCSNCNSMHMKISGHCLVCEDCGTTTGCS